MADNLPSNTYSLARENENKTDKRGVHVGGNLVAISSSDSYE